VIPHPARPNGSTGARTAATTSRRVGCQLETLLDKCSLPALELAQVVDGHLSE
jgi:hypothetical protein